MNNYIYIIAGLPDFTPDWRQGDKSLEEYLCQVKELLSAKDQETVHLIEDGFDKEKIGQEFYKEALGNGNAFIRDFFQFDLNVRNAKVRYLNQALGRDPLKDVLSMADPDAEEKGIEVEEPEFKEAARLQAILEGSDILARERGIDDLMWDKISALTTFHYFDIEVILGFVAKLNIVARWFRLDEQTGREMFKKLVDEVRGTFKGVEYNG